MIVKNKSKRCVRVSKVVLKPGSNLLNKEQVSDFNKSIDFVEDLIENGVLEVPELTKAEPSKPAPEKKAEETEEEDGDITSVADMNAKDAIALVEDTVDKSDLELYLEQETGRDEPRVTVVRAIEKQVNVIEEAQGGEGDQGDEDDGAEDEE